MKTIEDIQHAFYINLHHRDDRRIHVEKQLNDVGIKATRFNAIKMENGAIGCSLSHLKCLETAYLNNWSHVFICEDDITFLDPELFKKQFGLFFENRTPDSWDVVLFAGNNIPPYISVDESCIQVTRCQTTTGYLVNGRYIKKLMDNVKIGVQYLIQNPSHPNKYAIDKFWFYLQKIHKWFLIIPATVVQQAGYSDIEKKITNYNNSMLDIDKTRWV